MQGISIDKQIVIVLNEIFDKRRICALSFAIISIAVISVGIVWPNTYESSTTLIWNESQVVRPLLEGTAVTSSGEEQSQIAKEVIYSNRNLQSLINMAELNIHEDGSLMSEKEVEVLKSQLREKIVIERGRNNVLKISYRASQAENAYLVVSIISGLFIEETTQNMKADNFVAYNFIENQVNEYKIKLDEIEKRINQFKARNIEIQVDASSGVSTRINNLKDQIKSTSLQLREAVIQRDSLVEQLLIESQKSSAEEVVSVKNERLMELQNQLNTLRLSYTDTYPDIIQLKEQIKFLKDGLEADFDNKTIPNNAEKSESAGNFRSALYDRLSQQIADQQTVIKTLEARKLDQEKQFKDEISRSAEVNLAVSKLEELSRDRDVTKRLYDELLTKRENARVSLSLEMESAGSLFKIQEPPVIPLIPIGLRFLHFAMGSLVLGLALPLGVIIGILLIDPRVRHEDGLKLADEIPVIGMVPIFKSKAELRKQKFVTVQSILIFSFSLIAVTALSISHYFEVI